MSLIMHNGLSIERRHLGQEDSSMPVSRAIAWEIEASRGHSVWAVLCRTALRGVDLAARLFGLEENAEQVEHAELLVSYGVAPVPPRDAARPIDWANLSEFERGRVAREMKAAARAMRGPVQR
jgi:hypothetical protein